MRLVLRSLACVVFELLSNIFTQRNGEGYVVDETVQHALINSTNPSNSNYTRYHLPFQQ
jgi:hypothetical protein